ncbi:hypothetical protein BASA61_007667 [Batrachochytrium salamandrivorans]|nr:hypothetical protein BASA61_007667 [Batrachochytrium salamandrivorans]
MVHFRFHVHINVKVTGIENQALQQGFAPKRSTYDTDRKKIATLGTLLTDKALSWYNPYIEQPERVRLRLIIMVGFKARMKALRRDQPGAGIRDQAPCSQTRIFERRQEQQYNPRPFRRNPPPNQPVSRITLSSTNSNMLTTTVDQQIQQPSAPITATPVQQRPTSDDMDIDFARRGPLTSSNDNRGLVKDSALFAYSCFCSLFPRKTLLPGTLRLGPLSHVDTFFVDCGADDLLWTLKLAADLQIPLLELSTPITLRLADGDSSSSLTHRTVPLQLHIGKHVETATFLCNRPLPRFHSRQDFESPLAPDTISNPVELSPIDCSLSDSISLESMQSDVHPFAEVSPVSDASIPPDILPNFSLLLPKDQNPILTHRPETYNSQITSLSCREDYKATSESFNFQRILISIDHNSSRTSTAEYSYSK